jgi:MerR family transcriptional regulator/heat shock protein HspR
VPDSDSTTPSTRASYVISVAAELAGVHPQTLRIYERKGLLDPQRSRGGDRRYSDSDIVALRRILELTNAGVNLEGVRRVLALEEQVAALNRALEDARGEIAAVAAQIHRQYRRDLVPLREASLPVALRRQRRFGA